MPWQDWPSHPPHSCLTDLGGPAPAELGPSLNGDEKAWPAGPALPTLQRRLACLPVRAKMSLTGLSTHTLIATGTQRNCRARQGLCLRPSSSEDFSEMIACHFLLMCEA